MQGRSGVSGIGDYLRLSGFLGKYVVNNSARLAPSVFCHTAAMRSMCASKALATWCRQPDRELDLFLDIEDAVRGSNVVINLLGKHFETSRWSYNDVHVTFPGVLASVCAEQGVERFVHLAAMGAAPDAPSAWARSKFIGEESVRDAFPGATILRPATIFGDEDKFLNRIAKLSQLLPYYPMGSDAASAKQQPVYCDDVAQAIFNAATAPGNSAAGKTLELAGPKVYTNQEIFEVRSSQPPSAVPPSPPASPL